jgi:L-rhamnose mutarotase
MIRRAFTMRLKPGALAEYKRHHDAVWPELVREIERNGIATITTFEADPVLVLISEIHDEDAWVRLWDSEIHKKWGEIMSQLMEFKDGKVDSSPLREIFRLETAAKKRAGRAGAKPKKKAKKPVSAKVKKPAKKSPAKRAR